MDVPGSSRAARWSDAPPSEAAATAVVINSSEKRPLPSAVPELPFKKTRVDLGQAQLGDSVPNNDVADTPLVSSQSYNFINNSGAGHSYGSFPPGSAKGPGTAALFYKTKLCTKFTLGSCTFNERCHFAHGMEDLRKPPPGWEELVKQGATPTELITEPLRKSNKPCRYYANGSCPYGERCTFSHGNEDAQGGMVPAKDSFSGLGTGNASGRSNYKTRLCTRFEKGEPCMYGDKCHFAHGQAELQAYSGGTNYNTTLGTTPNFYVDQNKSDRTPLVASYSAPINYANVAGHPAPASTSSNAYPVAGGIVNSYGSQLDGNSAYPANYNYLNAGNKYDGGNPAFPPPTSTLPSQGYGVNAPWMSNYLIDGSHAQNEVPMAPPYLQQPPQHQPATPYYGSAPAYHAPNPSVMPTYQGSNQNIGPTYQVSNQNNGPTYQGSNQNINPSSYVQGVPQNGDGGGAIYGAGYSNQHAGYMGSYNAL